MNWASPRGERAKAPGCRRCLSPALWLPMPEHKRAQVEEPLADSVVGVVCGDRQQRSPRPNLRPRSPSGLSAVLGEMSKRTQKTQAEHVTRVEFLEALWYESTRAGLERLWCWAWFSVESGFRQIRGQQRGARAICRSCRSGPD